MRMAAMIISKSIGTTHGSGRHVREAAIFIILFYMSLNTSDRPKIKINVTYISNETGICNWLLVFYMYY